MLLLSFRAGTNVKAPGIGRPGRIVGFIADDDGQWRIVVSFPLVGGDRDLTRDFAPAELEITPEDRNPVLEACASALLGRKGHAFARHPSARTVAFDRSREALEV
jgi:hypothetical protein